MDSETAAAAASATQIRWRSLGLATIGLGLFVGALWGAPPFPYATIGMLLGGFMLGDGVGQVLSGDHDH